MLSKERFMTICSYHVTYALQSESTLYSCLNIKELLARSRREIWSLSDCNWTRTHNHLVHKRTLSHLAKLANWLSCVLSTYLYGAFDCMFLSCHVRVSEWIHTLNWLNGWVFVYELSGCWFESSCKGLWLCLYTVVKRKLEMLLKSRLFTLFAKIVKGF